MHPAQHDVVLSAVGKVAEQDPAGFLGSLLLSAFVCVFFSGLLAIQGTTYFRCFPNDQRWLKWVVSAILVLSIVQTVSWMYLSWKWFVVGFGDWNGLFAISGMFTAEPIISQLTISFAQAFFVYRCYILTQRNRVLVVLLVFGIIASLALFIVFVIDLAADLYSFPLRRTILLTTMSITIATDVVITGVTTWKLLTSKRGVNPSTVNGLSKLLQVTWEAAVPPAIAAIANLLASLYMGTNLVYIFFNILVTRLYVFSLMFTLNSRPAIRRVFNSSPAEWPLASLSSNNRSKQPESATTTRIAFAPIDTTRTKNTNVLSTMARSEIAEDARESHAHESVESVPLPTGQKEDEVSDCGTVSTIEDKQNLNPASPTSHFLYKQAPLDMV